MTNEAIENFLKQHELSVVSEFVPFSKSRNAKEKDKSLNWRVTLKYGKRDIITTDYDAGIGHCPAYQNAKGLKTSLRDAELIGVECERGFAAKDRAGSPVCDKSRPILPDAKDVIYSLIGDADALDYPTYEGWAEDLGFGLDSRSGEACYRACLEIGLRLRAGLGEKLLSELKEVFSEY